MLSKSSNYLNNKVSISCYSLCNIASTLMPGKARVMCQIFLFSSGIKSIILTPSFLCFYGIPSTQSMNEGSVLRVELLWNIR